MAVRRQPHALHILFLAVWTLFFTVASSKAGEYAGSGSISVYWGQHSDDKTEGSLANACDYGNYNIVIMESLIVYDDGSTPTLNLANHCGYPLPCSALNTTIKQCQDLGIKVFLSIGTVVSSAPPPDGTNVTNDLASYLVENFLTGAQNGPLGTVSLDGIDIADVQDSQHLHWDQLVTLLNASAVGRRIYISVSPQCVYPDAYLDDAIRTGHVDYIWVEFYYNNPSCIYSNGNAHNLLHAWGTWTSNVPDSLIFLGLTAQNTTAGYIEPEVVTSEILPQAKTASNYGGVMIWDRYFDILNPDYSGQIKDAVPKTFRCVREETPSTRFNVLARS